MRNIIYIAILLLSSTNLDSNGSKITFENGLYKNIQISLNPEIDPKLCATLIAEITNIFQESAKYLLEATGSRATFGSVSIVIPYGWTTDFNHCNINENDLKYDYETYEDSDFKITTQHPFAKSVPWTKQYKDCENESEAVFIPVEFLERTDFDGPRKGRLLLHEWMKLRYGVFEENGYYDDPTYSPCYKTNKTLKYTSCNANGGLKPILEKVGNEEITETQCRFHVGQNSEALKLELRNANASIMYNPHLANGYHICTNTTHNGLTPTKQNILCQRKSVLSVMNSHPDFRNQIFDFETKTSSEKLIELPKNLPEINYVRQKSRLYPAYFLAIEDSLNIREYDRIRHVKQGISEFVKLISVSSETHVVVYRYDGDLYAYSPKVSFNDTLASDGMKARLLTFLPDIDTYPPSASRRRGQSSLNKARLTNRSLQDIFRNAIDYMKARNNFKWELILFANNLPLAVNEAVALMKGTSYPVSIFTFNDSNDWLKFNTIHNTRKIIYLPYCFSQNSRICHGKTSSLIADHLLEVVSHLSVLNDEKPKQIFQKIVDVNVDGINPTIFNISSYQDSSNFQLFVPVYDNSTTVHITRPGSSIPCNTTNLLDYHGVKGITCPYVAGQWQVEISGNSDIANRVHIVQGYIESSENTPLIITSSYGLKLESEIFPRMNNRFPIYVSVTNKEAPVVYAKVHLDIFYQSGDQFYLLNQIELTDDGDGDPDITKDDGVYSALITRFSLNPSFHSGVITVTTSSGVSKILTGFENEAALLDSSTDSKCCGSSVRFSDSQANPIGFSSYSVVIPSFRTGESFNETENIIPPSRIISKILINEETESYLILQFVAPGGDHKNNTVSHYSICCTTADSGNLDDSKCADIDTAECNPVPYNATQVCSISLLAIYDEFYNSENPENVTTVNLFCGIRGIDSSGNAGPMSSNLIEISLDFGVLDEIRANVDECKSVQDGCLPIEVFWALIGCIAGLFLILFIVVLCWFCSKRKKSTSEKQNDKYQENHGISPPPQHIYNNNTDGPNAQTFPQSGSIPLHNVFIKKAYIQESNGQLSLVTSAGQFYDNNGSSSSPSSSRRRPVGEVNYRELQGNINNDDRHRKYVSWKNENSTSNVAPVFFSKTRTSNSNSPSKQNMNENEYSSSNSPVSPSHNYSTAKIENYGSEAPKAKGRHSRSPNKYSSPKFPQTLSNGTINDDHLNPTPNYASVKNYLLHQRLPKC